jgi:MFS family permease
MTAICASGIISGPVSGIILHILTGVWGINGWQWTFLLEGLPAIVAGVVAYFCRPTGPSRPAGVANGFEIDHLLTGGTSGIGLETARQFLKEGAKIIVAGVSPDSIARAGADIGNEVEVVAADSAALTGQRKLADSGLGDPHATQDLPDLVGELKRGFLRRDVRPLAGSIATIVHR